MWEDYFDQIEQQTKKAYKVAEKAREQGKDPEAKVDIPIARELPEKAESLISASLIPEIKDQGVKERIREIEDNYGKNDDRVALKIAEEIAKNKLYEFDTQEKAVEAGIRIGLAYMTGGVVTAPLEGIADIKIRDNDDGTNYLAVYYAGPIRSAGGTASAMSVLLADYVRKEVGLARYKPRDEEVKRYAVEVEDYFRRVTKKQYTPKREETEMIARNVPIEITGTPTRQIEVSNYKDLERIDTNRIRGGLCLIYLDGLPLKAPKIKKKIDKYGDEFGLGHWSWIEDYLELQHKIHSSDQGEEEEENSYEPSDKFLGDIVAGRPVFAHEGEVGGFRLRYGRSRATGLASVSMHPATMEVMGAFIAIGTQLKIEYPGKATVISPCDSVEPPIVRLNDGSLVRVTSRQQATKLRDEIEQVVFAGDVLVPYGEFLENGKRLLPSPWVEEWWALAAKDKLKEQDIELEREQQQAIENPFQQPSPQSAWELSKKLDLPLHPHYTYFWRQLSLEQFLAFYRALKSGKEEEDKLSLKTSPQVKKALEDLWLTHEVKDDRLLIKADDAFILRQIFDLDKDKEQIKQEVKDKEPLARINTLSEVEIRDKAKIFLGMRMGRPEKAERRTLKGKPQLLFPCGREEGGRTRNLMSTYEQGTLNTEVILNYCPDCNRTVPFSYCPYCGQQADKMRKCTRCGKKTPQEKHCGSKTSRHSTREINVKELMDIAADNLSLRQLPELLKSPRGVTSQEKDIEPLEKGLLREKYDLYVNKDGTIRYDSTDLTLTHFKPKEIGTSVETLRELGYEQDIHGQPLESEEQVLTLKSQDLVLSNNSEIVSAHDYLYQVANFVDDLLQDFYGLDSYYDLESPDDLVGELVVGLAPHTSGGIVGRIIGFTEARGIYAHPYWHAAKRRNCDGDEDSVILLLDALLNFSRRFLPDRRGSRSMDAPLILSSVLNPDEVDDEAWNVDALPTYPLQFYQATHEFSKPWNVDITIAEDLIRDNSYDFHYTHPVSDLTDAPAVTSYVTLGEMSEKVKAQLSLGTRVKAVRENEVAELLLKKHFLKDIKGNLRAFSRQKFRCVDCNSKYRRIPLQGKCTSCGGKLLLTISEGTIRKYLMPSQEIAEKYDISTYLKQQIDILAEEIQSIFGKEKRQSSLGQFVE